MRPVPKTWMRFRRKEPQGVTEEVKRKKVKPSMDHLVIGAGQLHAGSHPDVGEDDEFFPLDSYQSATLQ